MTTDRETFPPLGRQYWFARRLNRPGLFAGITTAEQRRERIRNEILSRGLADEPIGRRMGVSETHQETFERLYGQPLHVEQPTAGEPA